MIKRLVTFGCSRTFGTGMKDCFNKVSKRSEQTPSDFAWPSILSKLLNTEVVNLSRRGSSNKEIWKTIVDTKFQVGDLVIVFWTHFDRFCFFRSDIDIKRVNVHNDNRTSNMFYKYIHSEYDLALDFYLRCNHIKAHLQSMNIDNIQIITPEYFNKPRNNMKYDTFDWDTVDFLAVDFDKIRDKHPLALDGMHPNEQAHEEFAHKIYKEMSHV